MTIRITLIVVLSLVLGFPGGSVLGQELEPRSYRSLPKGFNFANFGFAYSSGSVLTDPNSPIQDLDLSLRTTSIAYLRSFGLFGRSASFLAYLPYGYISGSGILNGELASGHRSGWQDSRYKLTVNLLGAPAMRAEEFVKYGQKRNLGVSLAISAPTGQYDSTRIINFGANRWGFKPEIGYSSVRGKWIFDAAAGVWFFTANNDFFGGSRREQDPIGSLQGHISYNFKPLLWVAFDANYFTGGENKIDGEKNGELQRSSRIGVTLSLRLRPRHSLKLAAHTGAYTRVGADFDIFTVAYLYQWGGRKTY